MSLRFWEHYQKACEKHPFFAKGIMKPGVKSTEANRLWPAEAKGFKEYRNNNPLAENVLRSEIFEIWAAVAEGNLEQAHYEIADAVAVLIRLDEQLEALYEEEMSK